MFKNHDPIAILGLIIAIIVGCVQIYIFSIGTNVHMLKPSKVFTFIGGDAGKGFLSLSAETIFFNDTISHDLETIIDVYATLKIGAYSLEFLGSRLGWVN